MNVPVITIDGPSGSGKGTVARQVAQRLGWHLLDSGALYRLVALAAARAGVDVADVTGLAALARDMTVKFSTDGRGGERVLLEGVDVTGELRSETTGNAASRVAAVPQVRQALTERQHRFAEPPGLVADGRDMGTVIFPWAGLKIFLTATPRERALRRYKQLKDKGLDVSLAALSREVAGRDARDAGRKVAPLAAAGDAIMLDSTGIDAEAVVRRILRLAKERFGGRRNDDVFN
jgi:cytidylate kinase